MPVRPPALDDRNFDDLVEELLSRIPAHTPEWTHPRQGDPGRTLIELFAWLTDTLLYRVNLIPERQRLAFLRLLGLGMRPAIPARGFVSIFFDDDKEKGAVYLQPQALIKSFETRSELTVLPVTAEAYAKRKLATAEEKKYSGLVLDLKRVYRVTGNAKPYVTTPVFPGGVPATEGFDLVQQTVDRCLWFALLAAKPELVEDVRKTLGAGPDGRQQLLNVGVLPTIKVPDLFEDIGPRAKIPHVWEVSGEGTETAPEYFQLDSVSDGTNGLTQQGVMRLALPAGSVLGAPTNDPAKRLGAGVGDFPPRLDDTDKAARLVTWLRLRPTTTLASLTLSLADINAVPIDQQQTVTNRIVGRSEGTADTEIPLGYTSVDPASLFLLVEEESLGYQLWRRIDDITTARRDDAVYQLDPEAGTVRFGDGIRGRIPPNGARIQVAALRFGGGTAGNVPAGSLTQVTQRNTIGNKKLKVRQTVAMRDGADAETLEQAERRIPGLFRHRDRTVTRSDYQTLAAETPGVNMGRVEVLPLFKPQQRKQNVPGVVSVMVLPAKGDIAPPNPRPDRPFLETVHACLDRRRPLTTELYVIGCKYVPLGLSVGVSLRENADRDTTLTAVKTALRAFLWPLGPGGPEGTGWPLGRAVSDLELEVVVARVPGISAVRGINCFRQAGKNWQRVLPPSSRAAATFSLDAWELPELLSVVVAEGDVPNDLSGVPNPFGADGIAIPLVPEVC